MGKSLSTKSFSTKSFTTKSFSTKSFVDDADALEYFARASAAGSPFSTADKGRITSLIRRLKSEMGVDGVTSQWNSLDVLNLLAVHSKIAGFLNVKTSLFGNISMITDTGVFTAYKGYKGQGTTSKGDSNFNPFDGLNPYKFQRNDNCFGCYTNTNTREVKSLISNLDAANNGYELRDHTNGTSTVNGNAAAFTVNAVDCTGSKASRRVSSISATVYKNAKDSPTSTNATVTNATVNKTFKLFAREANGVYSLYSLNRMAFCYYGNSNIDMLKLERAILEEYLIPVGGALTKRLIMDGNSFMDGLVMPTKVMDLLWTNGIECTSLYNAVFGINTLTMISNGAARIDAYAETYFTKEALIFWETTNTIRSTTGATPATCMSQTATYIANRRAGGYDNAKFIVNTCMPFIGTNLTIGINPTIRENPSDPNDLATMNGLLRNGYISTLDADYLADVASDALFPDSGGVAGVGEKNLTYYNADEGHLSTVGYNYVGQNYLYPHAFTALS